MILFILLFLSTLFAWADEGFEKQKLPNELHVSTSVNSSQGRGGEIDGIFYFNNNMNIEFEAGGSRHQDDTIEDRTSSHFLLGFGSDPTERFSGGLQYFFWGLKDSLTVNTVRVPIRFRSQSSGWRLSLTPAQGVIQMPDIVILAQTYKVESEDKSLSLGVSYETPEDWIFGVNYTVHEYEKDLTKLSTSFLARTYTTQTLNLASALVNYRAAIHMTRKLKNIDLGFEVFTTEHAVDESVATGVAVQVDYYVKDNLKFDFQISRSQSKEGLVAFTDEEKEPYSDLTVGVALSFD